MPDLQRTPLFAAHQELKARLIDFAGWQMPVWYSSVVDEHRAVRSKVGMFDVSHMGRFEVAGKDAAAFLQFAVAADIAPLAVGHGKYTVLCYEDGGIVDDLILYKLAADRFLLVVNAANRKKDWDWLQGLAKQYDVSLRDRSSELAMLAVQGRDAVDLLSSLSNNTLAPTRRFDCIETKVAGVPCLVARTGYTGEDGCELMPPADAALPLWRRLLDEGVTPCGLGARDTLRLEAGYALYGNDIDASTNPIEAGLSWVVGFGKEAFSGREALLAIKATEPKRRLVGFKMHGKEIPRHNYPIVHGGRSIGQITSGTFSPTLEVGIGMGYIPVELSLPGTQIAVSVRDKPAAATVVKLPFYKRPAIPQHKGEREARTV